MGFNRHLFFFSCLFCLFIFSFNNHRLITLQFSIYLSIYLPIYLFKYLFIFYSFMCLLIYLLNSLSFYLMFLFFLFPSLNRTSECLPIKIVAYRSKPILRRHCLGNNLRGGGGRRGGDRIREKH